MSWVERCSEIDERLEGNDRASDSELERSLGWLRDGGDDEAGVTNRGSSEVVGVVRSTLEVQV